MLLFALSGMSGKEEFLTVTQNLGEESIFLQQLFSGVVSWLVIPSIVDNLAFSKNAGYLEILFLEGFQMCSGGGMKLGNRDLIIWVAQSCT